MTGERGRITVIGLGPGAPGAVTAESLAAVERIPIRRLRTAIHPSAHLVADAPTFDHHYEHADTFEQVYERIVADLVDLAEEHGRILYAVPGSPDVLERTVALLHDAAEAGRIDLEVLPAVSFVDLVWSRLGIDPFEAGVNLVDGHRFEEMARGRSGPMLIAHCHNRRVLSDIKLAVEHPPTAPVTVLQRLGTPEETVHRVDWADLDRSFEPDHLTTIFVPELGTPVGGEVAALVDLVGILRRECPWDARQTHASLTPHLIEETYEVVDALDAVGDGGPDTDADAYADLEEELGDLLFQIVFHATIADETGAFDLDDVARGIGDKLRHRHPHVFPREGILGDATVEDAADVAVNWERIKKAEKGRGSVFDGIPRHLPALARAAKVLKKIRSLDLDPDDVIAPAALPSDAEAADDRTIGRMLHEIVAAAAHADIDPEAALRTATDALEARMRASENEPDHRPGTAAATDD